MAWLLGARVDRGVVGWLVIIAVASLVAAGCGGISHGIALLVRREETLIAILNFFGLPLIFISAILIAESLMPDWMQWAARFNPVNWGVVASREMSGLGHRLGSRVGLLSRAPARVRRPRRARSHARLQASTAGRYDAGSVAFRDDDADHLTRLDRSPGSDGERSRRPPARCAAISFSIFIASTTQMT